MFCSKCGKQIADDSVFCPYCGAQVSQIGAPVNNYVNFNPGVVKVKKGKGIASMILGILAVWFSISLFSLLDNLDVLLAPYSNAEKVSYAFGLILFPLIFSIVGICLACSERKDNKNGFNTAGFWLTLVSFVLISISFLYVVTY